jgi:hypothetical protein
MLLLPYIGELWSGKAKPGFQDLCFMYACDSAFDPTL